MIKQKHIGIGQTERKEPKRKDKKQKPTFPYTKKSHKITELEATIFTFTKPTQLDQKNQISSLEQGRGQ